VSKYLFEAVLTTVWAFAPVVALLYWNWRAALLTPVLLGSLALFPVGALAAGGMVTESGGNPMMTLILCWGLGVAGLLACRRMMKFGPGIREKAVMLGFLAAGWALVFYPMAKSFWSFVALGL
jgi:hypothetical protein